MAQRGRKDESQEAEPEQGAEGQPAEAESAAPKKARRERASAEGLPAAIERLIEGLDEIVPGLEVLDRELVFESGARADVAAVDPAGRLFLILLAPEDGDRAALEVLDTLRVARSETELLVRHFGAHGVSGERAPRVLVVTPASDEALARRLAALADVGVLVFGLRTVKSARHERSYLVRLDPDRSVATSGGPSAFLRGLPPRLEPLANLLMEKMGRIDEELVCSGDASTLVWRLGGEVLCRVERIGDLLQASVAPDHQAQPLGEAGDLERLVERAMNQLVRALGLSRAEGAGPGPRSTLSEEPILTQEEIQAFRE